MFNTTSHPADLRLTIDVAATDRTAAVIAIAQLDTRLNGTRRLAWMDVIDNNSSTPSLACAVEHLCGLSITQAGLTFELESTVSGGFVEYWIFARGDAVSINGYTDGWRIQSDLTASWFTAEDLGANRSPSPRGYANEELAWAGHVTAVLPSVAFARLGCEVQGIGTGLLVSKNNGIRQALACAGTTEASLFLDRATSWRVELDTRGLTRSRTRILVLTARLSPARRK